MALHPFQFFRKRQKSMLAGLTILSMFIFILTGFSGSIVDRFGGWFGTGRKNNVAVTKLYGKTVTVGEYDQVLQGRRLADAFIKNAILSGQPHLSDAEYQEVSSHVRNMMLEDIFGRQPGMYLPHLRAYRQELLKANKTEAARFVQHELRSIELRGLPIPGVELNTWAQSHPGQVYFGGGLAPDDLLDFLIWRKQADKLNVNLTDVDLRMAVNQEAGDDVLSGDQVKDDAKIRLYVQQAQVRNLVPKDVFAALRDEFRVRLAKEVLLGSAGGARAAMGGGVAGDQVPAAGTPDQFREFYQDNRTTLNVAFLKVPVSQFTGQVKEKPTDEELKDLFNRYKNEEPSPDRATPGFKVPRKVKVEWVTADPDSPHYREAAEKALPVLSATQPLSLLPFPAVSGGTSGAVAAIAGQMAVGSLWNAPVEFQYASVVKGV